ncbi:MAG TPA: helix-turn-helix domain-containing protein, partial [Spirochaetales bacterium]|nr:helix-turn-helix domain-containing protein [Spirochaetales bacterium]
MLNFSELSDNGPDSVVYRVAALVRELNAALTSRIGESLAPTGLTLPQLLLVKALAHAGDMTIGDVARELYVSKPTAVG